MSSDGVVSRPVVVALTKCKGGVGASMLTVNLGIFFAQVGRRVLVLDLDRSHPGLGHWLGGWMPSVYIDAWFSGEVSRLEEVVCATQVTGLYAAVGRSGAAGRGWSERDARSLLDAVARFDADLVLIDVGGGIDAFSRTILDSAHAGVLVTQPLPDAIAMTYRMMNAWFGARMARVDPDLAVAAEGPERSARAWAQYVAEQDGDAGRVAQEAAVFQPVLVVNQVKLKDDEQLGEALVSASTRWLGVMPVFGGAVGWDDNVWLAHRRSKVLLTDFARSRVCKDLEQVVRRLTAVLHHPEPAVIPPAVDAQNLYEVLEIHPGATEEEIRRAHRRIKQWFGLDAMAVHGACTAEELQHFQKLADEAHARLLDRSFRREYDRRLFPDGALPERKGAGGIVRNIAGTVVSPQATLPPVEVDPGTKVDGAFLGNLRKERRIELEDVSNRTKVSVRYLRAIEEERFADLPSDVFTRGFVKEFARFLKVDPQRAVRDFFAKRDQEHSRRNG